MIHPLTVTQDWLYEDGEDTSKAQYISKMDEIRFSAGPVIQRYNDKIEGERQAKMQAQQEAAARKHAEMESKKREEEAKKASAPQPVDTEMKDAEANAEVVKPSEVEEPPK